MEDWIGKLVSWSEFLLFHVLPIAVAQMYDWVRDWQILVVAILVLTFFHFWTRAILKAARQAARETVQSETRGLDAGLKLLRQRVEEGRESSKPASAQAVPRGVPETPRQPPPQIEAKVAVDRLRKAIRLALGSIPVSDGPLSPEGTRLYRAAIGSLVGAHITVEDRQGVLGKVLAELDNLDRSFPPQSCRQAWQSLVKVNALAREFHEPAVATIVRRATP